MKHFNHIQVAQTDMGMRNMMMRGMMMPHASALRFRRM